MRVAMTLLTLLCLVSTAQARTLYDRPSVPREGLQAPGDVVSEHYRNGAIEALTRELGKVADTLQGIVAEMNERALARASQRDWRRVEFAQYLHACPIPDERTVAKCPQPDTPVQGWRLQRPAWNPKKQLARC